jgi:hypothetical protein
MPRRIALALFFCSLPLLLAAGCGDDDDAGGASPSTIPGAGRTPPVAAATNSQLQPSAAAPASRYSLLLTDIGTNAYLTDIPKTFVLTAETYATAELWKNPEEGVALLKKWGYADGYETAFTPEGATNAVLNGSFFVYNEVHRFNTSEGAHQAYEWFNNKIAANGIAQPVTASAIGNESNAWKTVRGKIGASNQFYAYHQIIFRRGNIVAIVQTVGADPFMKVDTVFALAQMADAKVLGEREAIAPTPVSKKITPPPTPVRTPTPQATTTR